MKPITLNDATFHDQISKSEIVLIDFWASWCLPCRAMAPLIDEISREYENQLFVGKLNVDANPATAAAYGITGIPTLLFIKNGQVVDRVIGLVNRSQLETRIGRLLTKTGSFINSAA